MRSVLSDIIAPCHRRVTTVPPIIVQGIRATRSVQGFQFQRCSARFSSSSSKEGAATARSHPLLEGQNLSDSNIPPSVLRRLGTNLHLQPLHPLHTIKSIIERYWGPSFRVFDSLSPVVSVHHNFDSLLIPQHHTSRSRSDTYYIDHDTVLRTHTSAHQTTLLQRGIHRFLVSGDVYRRDEIDSSHYPIFHQMEGVKMYTSSQLTGKTNMERLQFVERDLKIGLEGMIRQLFGKDVIMRWDPSATFPFTDPSFELELWFDGRWLEVLGCGVVHSDILQNVGRPDDVGWAFGLGLERLAMILFSIPDIRLFWSRDPRFVNQFRDGDKIVPFVPYSKYPPCFKDISFWITPPHHHHSSFHINDLNEIVRTVAGDLVEKVELIDEFTHPTTKRVSNCFRISYRSMDRNLTNEEIDSIQDIVRETVVHTLGVEIR